MNLKRIFLFVLQVACLGIVVYSAYFAIADVIVWNHAPALLTVAMFVFGVISFLFLRRFGSRFIQKIAPAIAHANGLLAEITKDEEEAKSPKKLGDYRTLLVLLFVGLLIVTVVIAFCSPWIFPKQGKNFFTLGILGADETTDNYYPKNNATIQPMDELQWHIFVANHMQSVQRVLIKVKLINSTIPHPDSVNLTPTPQEYEIMNLTPTTINSEESVTFPFFWKLLEFSIDDDVVTVNKLMINDQVVNVDVTATNGVDFRIVFELWCYDVSSGEYSFSWDSKAGQKCAWTQMIFDVAV